MLPYIRVGDYSLSSYVLCATVAAISAALCALPAVNRAGLGTKRLLPMLFTMCVAFLVGARLWNFAVCPSSFAGALKWYSLKLSGMSFNGGATAAIATLLIFHALWQKSAWRTLDALVIPSGIAFCIARVGCFLNGCCCGKLTDSALGIVFPSKIAVQQEVSKLIPFLSGENAVYPTQLFELTGAAVAAAIAVFAQKALKLRDGGRFLVYGACFCTMRLAILPLRALPYSAVVTTVTYPLFYSFAITAFIALLIVRQRKQMLAK